MHVKEHFYERGFLHCTLCNQKFALEPCGWGIYFTFCHKVHPLSFLVWLQSFMARARNSKYENIESSLMHTPNSSGL